jgi:hypothetical protein
MKDTIECSTSASYLDVLLTLDANGKLMTHLYDKLDFFSVNFPTYVAIFHLHSYFAVDLVYKSMFDIRSVFNSRQSTDKQIDVTRVSTVSFVDIFLQILRSSQRSNLQIQSSLVSNAFWCFSYQSLHISRSWHTDLDYASYCLSDLEMGAHGVCDWSTRDVYSS